MLRIVDLFCGIGGVAEATRADDSLQVVCAVDIDQNSNHVYAANHGLHPTCRALESIRELPEGDVLWLSPPCQPYTRRGRQRQENDPRSAALSNVIELLDRSNFTAIIVENVPEFADSFHHRQLERILERKGFAMSGQALCPTQWGVPMRRKRFYFRASRQARALEPIVPERIRLALGDVVESDAWEDPSLDVTETVFPKFADAMDIVDIDDPAAITACFTSAYGGSPVRAGSYLRCRRRQRVRQFSVREIAKLMGYRRSFCWPSDFSKRLRYRLIGNALSVTVTRALLKSLVEPTA